MARPRPRHPDAPALPNVVACVVHEPPASLTEPLGVIVPGFDGRQLYVVKRWQSRGATLPAKGDRGLIAKDEDGEPWLVGWWPAGGDVPGAAGGGDYTANVQHDFGGDLAAAFAALAIGDTLFVPNAVYALTAPLVNVGVHMVIERGAVFDASALAGSGEWALTVTEPVDSGQVTEIAGLPLLGPGSWPLPWATDPVACMCGGIRSEGPVKVRLIAPDIRGFDQGVTWASDIGHCSIERPHITGNRFGVWWEKNTADYQIIGGDVAGQAFADLGTPADVGISALTMLAVHLGYAPYSIWQSPSTSGADLNSAAFLGDCHLHTVQMEACGNAGILSESVNDDGVTTKPYTSDLVWQGRFRWSDTYRIASRARDYAIDLPYTYRSVRLISDGQPPRTTMGPGPSGLPSGALNAVRIKDHNDILNLEWPGASEAAVTIDSGPGVVQAGAVPLLQRNGHISVEAVDGPLVGDSYFAANFLGALSAALGFDGNTGATGPAVSAFVSGAWKALIRLVAASEAGTGTGVKLSGHGIELRGQKGTGAADGVAATDLATVGQLGGGGTLDPELAALVPLVSAADRLAYYTGSGVAALATFTAFARTLLDDADAATARATLAAAGLAVANTFTQTQTISAATALWLSDAGARIDFGPSAEVNIRHAATGRLGITGEVVSDKPFYANYLTAITAALGYDGTAAAVGPALSAPNAALSAWITLCKKISDTEAGTGTGIKLSGSGLDARSGKLTSLANAAAATDGLPLGQADGRYQALEATLTALAGVTTAADKLIYATGADVFATTTFTAFMRTLLDDADAATARGTLGISKDAGMVTALPGSPANGDRCTLVDSTAAPTYAWDMIYNATANAWFCTGATPLRVQPAVANVRQLLNQTAYASLPTDPLSVTVPRAGDYEAYAEAAISLPATINSFGKLSMAAGATAASDAWHAPATTQAAVALTVPVKTPTTLFSGLAASDAITEKAATGGNYTVGWTRRRLIVKPVKLT